MIKILLNRQSAKGDVLMTTPIIRKLYKDYNGKCIIDYYVRSVCSDVLEHNPYIHKISNNTISTTDYKKYDIIIDLDLVYENNPSIHAVDAYAKHVFRNTNFDRSLDLFTTTNDVKFANDFSKDIGNNYVVLHMRKSNWLSRNMPESFWKQVIEYILINTDLTIVQVGMPWEHFFTGVNRVKNCLGKFSIHQLKEVIAKSVGFLGSDSCPAHIAGTTNVRMVVLYTSVKQEYRRPIIEPNNFIPIASDIECYGCQSTYPVPCTEFICKRGDTDCVNRFDPILVAKSLVDNKS